MEENGSEHVEVDETTCPQCSNPDPVVTSDPPHLLHDGTWEYVDRWICPECGHRWVVVLSTPPDALPF
jgi:transposase-like protein